METIVLSGAAGVYPFRFAGTAPGRSEGPGPSGEAREEARVDAPIVGHQLVCSQAFQILSFLAMDLPSFTRASEALFPKLPRKEGLKLVISANGEILNSASARFGALMAKLEGGRDAAISPPLVSNFSGPKARSLKASETVRREFRGSGISFRFLALVQEL